VAVIMLTGHGSAEAAHEGIREGAYDYLTKPCEFEELVEKIRNAHHRRPTS
jgi:FixJ family two-component response regulator